MILNAVPDLRYVMAPVKNFARKLLLTKAIVAAPHLKKTLDLRKAMRGPRKRGALMRCADSKDLMGLALSVLKADCLGPKWRQNKR